MRDTGTARTRSWREIGDSNHYDEYIAKSPARKRARTSSSGSWREWELEQYTRDTSSSRQLGITQQSEENVEVDTNTDVTVFNSGDGNSSILEARVHPTPFGTATSTSILDDIFIREQPRLPLTPLPLLPLRRSQEETARRRRPALPVPFFLQAFPSSRHQHEKRDDNTYFDIYEDPTDPFENMDMDLDAAMDIDSTGSPQQSISDFDLSENKENTEDGYGSGGNGGGRTEMRPEGSGSDTETATPQDQVEGQHHNRRDGPEIGEEELDRREGALEFFPLL
ncbi:hypothetical protein MPDQ_007072 [Monascus purpureus]|uniref:Uncharacterized protein n=1 Tax=Monascus purpureus TaxID=5098 RepID=A0A507R6K5_MONPU|nr:hypothetical protein MPDQ_007072 [Monascus purpureus]